jgi:hypothetical protein
MDFVNAVLNLDRRIIYTIVGFAVVLPLLFPLKLPIVATPEVHGIFDFIEGLPDGSDIHCFEKNHKVHLLTLWPGGPALMQSAIEAQAAVYDRVSGTDYAYLGYRAGGVAVMLGMTGGITGTFLTRTVDRLRRGEGRHPDGRKLHGGFGGHLLPLPRRRADQRAVRRAEGHRRV